MTEDFRRYLGSGSILVGFLGGGILGITGADTMLDPLCQKFNESTQCSYEEKGEVLDMIMSGMSSEMYMGTYGNYQVTAEKKQDGSIYIKVIGDSSEGFSVVFADGSAHGLVWDSCRIYLFNEQGNYCSKLAGDHYVACFEGSPLLEHVAEPYKMRSLLTDAYADMVQSGRKLSRLEILKKTRAELFHEDE